jgi:hypothetical protein
MRRFVERSGIRQLQEQVQAAVDLSGINELQLQMQAFVERSGIRELQEQVQAAVDLSGINKLQEQMRRLVEAPGVQQLQEQLQAVSRSVLLGDLPGLAVPIDEARIEGLRDAVMEWSEAASTSTQQPAASEIDVEFGWIDLLPTFAQLKLLVATMDILNATLLLLSYLEPESAPPMALLLVTEVLIRLVRTLLDRLE